MTFTKLHTSFSWVLSNPVKLTVAYIEKKSYEELVPVNVALLRTAMTAVDALAPNLEHVVLQTGGKVIAR
jgi:hypothetical protein